MNTADQTDDSAKGQPVCEANPDNTTKGKDVSRANADNRTKAQKAVPASLLKQLRATAALMCYDNLFGEPTMPAAEF